jgi:serine/threonine-protein kinase HipA
VSGNLDAHLKNWALWYPDRVRPRLAPAYDQVCVVALPGFGWDQPTPPRLALSFAGSPFLVDLDRDRVRRWVAAADLPGIPAEELFLDGIRTAMARWGELRNEAPASMVSALALHHRAVPVIQSMW